jgi:hypothetical protein
MDMYVSAKKKNLTWASIIHRGWVAITNDENDVDDREELLRKVSSLSATAQRLSQENVILADKLRLLEEEKRKV